MSETNYNLMFAMEFDIPRLSPCHLSGTGMKEDSNGLFTYREYASTLKNRVKELEQQLSNSISKDELRGLVDDLSRMTEMEYPRKEIVAKLNKLIEGDKNG